MLTLKHTVAAMTTVALLASSSNAQFGIPSFQSMARGAINNGARARVQSVPRQTVPRQAVSNGNQSTVRRVNPNVAVNGVIRNAANQMPVATGSASVQSEERFAMIVATRDYSSAGMLPSLAGTNRDAEMIAQALRDGGYRDDHIVMLYDDSPEESLRPTSENVEAKFFEFLNLAESGVATIFFIGHGISHDGKSYYCAQDTTDDSLANPNPDAPGLISITAVANVFSNPQRCAAEHKLIVVDACRNELMQQYGGLVQGLSEVEKTAENVWLLSSCSEGQRSWISDTVAEGERHAVFTYHLAKGLAGAADLLGDNDGQVGLFELFTYAFVKTNGEVKGFGITQGKTRVEQTPELFGVAPPFELATVSSLVARRTLTTGDVAAEARRSANQIADDMLTNLRVSEANYRSQIATDSYEQLHQAQHDYLSYLLGNRIRAALEIDPECRLAHTARGITYRASGEYAEALESFRQAGETLELFVKADLNRSSWNYDSNEQGQPLKDKQGNLIPILKPGNKTQTSGFVTPSDDSATVPVPRESKLTITEIKSIDGEEWVRFNAINNSPIKPLWIPRDQVHWLPAAVDIYTPTTAMRPLGGGGASAVTRLDYAAENLNQLADQLALPSQQLHQIARQLSVPGQRIRQFGANAGAPLAAVNNNIGAINGILGRFGVGLPYVPNYPARIAGDIAYWVDRPSTYAAIAAGYAAIPSGYVRRAGGYVQMPANKIRGVQGWTGVANAYHSGVRQEARVEKQRKELKDNGDLGPVKATPIKIAELRWLSPLDDESDGADKKEKAPKSKDS